MQISSRCLSSALLSLLVFSLSAFNLPAQTLGEITGVIRDASGGVIPGATVTVINPATNFTRTAVSNEAGVYNFPSLQPGKYNLKVEMSGFRTVTRNDVELQVQQSARLDFGMEVGSVSEIIEVSGTTALIASENATVGTVIDNQRIVDMPLNGRNFLQLVSTSSHVSQGFNNAGQAGARQGGTRSTQNIAVAGQRSMFNRFTLDGVENTDVNFNTYVILPSIDALQEFKVQTGVFPAEFGRATSQINVSTKSGTNSFHGSLFEFHRNDKLDAKQYAFTSNRPPKDPFKWNQYGFTVGGPIWIPKVFNGRNRLFFMTNFEGFRERRTTQGFFNVPSAAMREGNFSEISTPLYDPLARTTQFPGNIIPRNRIHPTSLELLEFYPAPNVNTGSLVSNHQNARNNRTDKDQFIVRIDFVENAKSNWFGRYSFGDEEQINPNFYLNGSKLLTNVDQAMIGNTRVFSPSVVNEFRAGYNYFFNSLGRELANERDVVSELDIPGISLAPPIAWGIPSISVQGFSGFGDDSEGPYVNKNHLYQFVDNLSWTRGKHSLRFGVEIRNDQYNQIGNQFARGAFLFEANATSSPGATIPGGYGFADFLLGYCKRCEASVALAEAHFRATSQYWYVDDTWKIHPNVTLNLGLRYEFTPTWFDTNGTLVNAHIPAFDNTPNVQDLSRHPTLVRIGSGDFYENIPLRFNPAIKVARDGRLGEKLVKNDLNDFAPRLGIAWSPNLKWVVRAGAGMFYSQDTGNPRFDMARNMAGRRRDEATPTDIGLNWDAPFRNLGGTVQINNPYVLANIFDRRSPYSFQYLLNVQREVGKDTAVEIGYLGSVSRKLESLRAFNESIPGATGTVLERAPYPEFGRIQEVDGSGKANYNSLGAKVQRRFSDGLTYLFAYTWARSIDTASAIRNHAGDTLFPQNSYELAAERAPSSFNTTHRAVSTVLYELPFGKGRQFLNQGGVIDAFLGGWQLGTILALQSGFPITVVSGLDRSNTGAGFDRPNYVPGETVALPRGEQDPELFFNTRAFLVQPLGTFGNVGRNTLTGPGLIQWDFSIHKDFRIVEGQFVQFRFEAFNFPNHPNWGDPNTSVTATNYGKIRGTRTNMRELQFALKYVF
jgi:Carboxypeptidase regulatory-like domain